MKAPTCWCQARSNLPQIQRCALATKSHTVDLGTCSKFQIYESSTLADKENFFAKDCVWELVQDSCYSSSELKDFLGKLKLRKRLQSNPFFPAALQVECPRPRCLGIGYLGYDTVMCFLCEHQWEDSGEKPLKLSGACIDELEAAGVRVQQCPKCHEYIEKNGGCDHMTCRCGHQFSWTTLKTWGSLVAQ